MRKQAQRKGKNWAYMLTVMRWREAPMTATEIGQELRRMRRLPASSGLSNWGFVRKPLRYLEEYGLIERCHDLRRSRFGRPAAQYVVTVDGVRWLMRQRRML